MYICKECSLKYTKWLGKCNCGSWDIVPESEFEGEEIEVFTTEIKLKNLEEINLVCKLIKPSLVLLGGEPGVGKSTLMCQLAASIKGVCLYLAGEEAASSVKSRLMRVSNNGDVIIKGFTNMEMLEGLLEKYKPDLLILDSIHTTRYRDEDNTKEIMFKMVQLAKKHNFCGLLVSHITKEGVIAGPKTLEHTVDVVLYLEGDRYSTMRMLRSIKNRFGPTDELAVFEMGESGLKPIVNPSAMFLANRREGYAGSVIFAGISGTRPFLTEVQALVVNSVVPSIDCIGFDYKRLKMILAILNKWCNLKLFSKDIFVTSKLLA